MLSFLLYAAGIGLVLIWARASPAPRLGRLFALWVIGVVLLRLVPTVILLTIARNAGGPPPSSLRLMLEVPIWVGALALLRSLLGLAQWQRPRNRRLRVWQLLLVGFFVLAGSLTGQIPLAGLLAVPFLLSFRWRNGLTAGQRKGTASSGRR